MTDLFAPTLPAEHLNKSAFRMEPVVGDSMAPRLRGGFDYVMIKPIHQYAGEGTYFFSELPGAKQLYKAESVLGSQGKSIRLFYENRAYQGAIVSREWFEENVLGIVVADIKVQYERFLREAA